MYRRKCINLNMKTIYNLSRKIYLKNIPLIPKLLRAFNRIVFTCDIPYKADIHETVSFPHNGLGVVINDTAKIGENSKIMNHVTIGGNLDKVRELDGKKIHAAQIGTNVLVGSGATLLGPIIIGNGSKIGAGAVITKDVPENSIAVGVPAKLI